MVSTILFGWKSTKPLWKEKNRTDSNTQKKEKNKLQTSERIKNTSLFMCFSSKTHQIEKCNKENECFNMDPEMSVSEDGSWNQNMKEKEMWGKKNHVQFHRVKLQRNWRLLWRPGTQKGLSHQSAVLKSSYPSSVFHTARILSELQNYH